MAKDTYIPRDEVVDMNKEFDKVLKNAEKQLMKFPGVVSVGVGLKEIKGELQRELCFKVTVKKKKAKPRVRVKDRIPEDIFGFKTDVDQIEVGVSFGDDDEYRPLIGGCKIGSSEHGRPGTLGCFAKRNDNDKIVALSNWHVMVDNPDAIDDDRLGQPSHSGCCSCCSCNEFGKVTDGQFKFQNMDAAIAILDGQDADTFPEKRYLNEVLEIGLIAGSAAPLAGETVYKRGYFTGLTRGQISNNKITSNIQYKEYNDLIVTRTNQCEISPRELRPGVPFPDFAINGDSGAVVVNELNQVVALLFGGILSTHRTHATDITKIEAQLGISILNSTFPQTPNKSGVPLSSIASANIQLSLAHALRELESELAHYGEGKRMLEVFKIHRNELLHLVRTKREVMAAWHRFQGPAYLSNIARSVRRENKPIPEQIKGITLQSLLLKMTAVLQRNGSPELVKSVQENYLQIMNVLAKGRSPQEWKTNLAMMDNNSFPNITNTF